MRSSPLFIIFIMSRCCYYFILQKLSMTSLYGRYIHYIDMPTGYTSYISTILKDWSLITGRGGGGEGYKTGGGGKKF